MKLAIMQPYLFPYIGYFQLINAVDKFVAYDDVQYRKGGWINRNRILLNGKDHLFTFGVKKDSFQLNINQRFFSNNLDEELYNFFSLLEGAYKNAPFFSQVMELLKSVLIHSDKNIAITLTQSLKCICWYLDIKTPFLLSSDIPIVTDLKGEDRVIALNKYLGADHYINPIGGIELYSKETFMQNGLKLSFLRSKNIQYSQLGGTFVPSLSIIDLLMFNSKEQLQRFLNEYEII